MKAGTQQKPQLPAVLPPADTDRSSLMRIIEKASRLLGME